MMRKINSNQTKWNFMIVKETLITKGGDKQAKENRKTLDKRSEGNDVEAMSSGT